MVEQGMEIRGSAHKTTYCQLVIKKPMIYEPVAVWQK